MVNGGNQMHNFTTLIKRLEAATSRLEDMATTFENSPSEAVAQPRTPASPFPHQAHQPSTQAATASPAAASSPAFAGPVGVPKTVQDFDEIINSDVREFFELGEKIGEPVAGQVKAMMRAFQAERTYIYVAAIAKKPETQPPELLAELRSASEEINNIRENNRPSPLFNHLSAIAEGIMALGWFFESKPVDFVKETFGSAQFYGNRVLKDYKDKEDGSEHVAFIQAYYKTFRSLTTYIEKNFLGGLTWNNKDGIDATDALKEAKAAQISAKSPSPPQTTPAAGPPPPPAPAPPPPPPLPTFDLAQGPPKPAGGDMSDVFNQLNQGEKITSKLRHVDKSQMTHKNPSLRAQAAAAAGTPDRPASSGSSSAASGRPPSKKPKPESMRARKPGRTALNGNKWTVENYERHEGVLEIEATIQQSVLISRCHNTVVKVANKANAITCDNCTGLSLIVDSLISSLEVIKCPKFQLQIDGAVPTLLLEQVDGASIYLGEASLGSEFVSSKCSNINIVLPPKEGADEDGKECPVPEQIRSTIRDGVLVSEVVEHAA